MRLPSLVLLIACSATAFGAVGGGGGGGGSMGGGGGVAAGGNGVAAGGNGNNNNNGNNNGNNNNYYQPNPADVEGQKYEVVFIPDASTTMGGVKTSSMLFKAKDLECDYLALWNITDLPYTRHNKDAKTMTFNATVADDAGNSLKLAGTATQNGAIKGTLAIHKASGNQTLNYSFHGGVPGSSDASDAEKEAKDAQAKAK